MMPFVYPISIVYFSASGMLYYVLSLLLRKSHAIKTLTQSAFIAALLMLIGAAFGLWYGHFFFQGLIPFEIPAGFLFVHSFIYDWYMPVCLSSLVLGVFILISLNGKKKLSIFLISLSLFFCLLFLVMTVLL